MDLFQFLLNDQRTIRARLDAMRGTTYRATRTRMSLLRDAKELLEALAEFEQGVLYPLLKHTRSLHALLQECERDHKQIKHVLKKWIAVPPNDDEWEQHFHALDGVFRSLASRERTKLFPRARKLLSPEQLEDMSMRAQETRNELEQAKLRVKLSEE